MRCCDTGHDWSGCNDPPKPPGFFHTRKSLDHNRAVGHQRLILNAWPSEWGWSEICTSESSDGKMCSYQHCMLQENYISSDVDEQVSQE